MVDRKAPSQPSRLTEAHRAALEAIIEQGPTLAIHSVVRWRLVDLGQWLWEEFRVSVSKQALSREVRALGYRKLSTRPPERRSGPPLAACSAPSPQASAGTTSLTPATRSSKPEKL
ncbi:winged helix-turn-helix domain-containing protein [Roseomonas chloroacetimidivorans]|uniref:winged helix-turn-helix domain-containing protein n=1 Tax=Roseomonas chloroacetimidivorans TaxID=1766656 RepID=UPI003C740206